LAAAICAICVTPLTSSSLSNIDNAIYARISGPRQDQLAMVAWAWIHHLGRTLAQVCAAPAAWFGITSTLTEDKEARIHDATRALRRAFIGDRRPIEAPTAPLVAPIGPHAVGAATAAPKETEMQKTLAHGLDPQHLITTALREAFEAGRAQKAKELEAIMAAFLDDL
jgi:hypothetical protein